jgi:chorismate mutase
MVQDLFKAPYPRIVAGPCSVESEEQMLSTARALAQDPRILALRGGVWKPRTQPGTFEGIGPAALPWLKKASQETGLPVITEVANVQHVEQALEAGIDMLWIGARTTVNPFYVEEIAEALRGTSIPVLVKNPIHPELKLWLGALERLEKKGISQLMAIHRGFYAYQSQPFRNEPKWEIFFALRTQRPDIPVLCDPSHIAGKSELIGEVAQSALDLGMEGLIIESHHAPGHALSDARQQVTPRELSHILDHLVYRKEAPENERFIQKLEDLRRQIDRVDEQLLDILRERLRLVEQIGPVKEANEATIFQMRRWFKVLENRKQYGTKKGLDPEIVHELFQLIHKYSIDTQLSRS